MQDLFSTLALIAKCKLFNVTLTNKLRGQELIEKYWRSIFKTKKYFATK